MNTTFNRLPALGAAMALAALVGLGTGVRADENTPNPPLKPVGVVGNPGGTGPNPAIAESVASLRAFTLYRPLKMADSALPLVIWGEGACADNGLAYADFLREISSHGFFIIAVGYAREEANEFLARTGGEAGPNGAPRFPKYHENDASTFAEALTWADAETKRSGGPFHGKIDMTKIGVMGHSCGGLQAMATAADPRITTTIIMNSGVVTTDKPGPGSMGLPKEALGRLHGPILYVMGGPTDVAYKNAVDDYGRINNVPLYFTSNDVGHGGTYWEKDGGDYAKVATDWLSWQLKGDQSAAHTFVGPDCGLCAKSRWSIKRKQAD
jgi:dienelactone hydrolase